ncbi:hypothetical protein WA026_010198 [Henosepilachna vigintioctopunctata]|uniref:Uncharacterized protein n=1 Tax=Henosepilachna vigintioctopunctata TaxID=420089 RepID=A0AAW1ULL3_9CUCU
MPEVYNMKLIYLFALVVGVVHHVNSLKIDFSHHDPPHKDCAGHGHAGHGHGHGHVHFPQANIEKLNRGETVDLNCPEFTQHLLCIWKEKGVMNEEGVLQKEVITSKVSKIAGSNTEDIKKVENCAIQQATPGKTAIHFYNCIAPLVKKYNS